MKFFNVLAPLSPNSISKLFNGRFENESPASIGGEINQSNTRSDDTKHLDNVMETENNVEAVSNEDETRTCNSQISGANKYENESNKDENKGNADGNKDSEDDNEVYVDRNEVAMDNNEDNITGNKVRVTNEKQDVSNITLIDEKIINIVDDDKKIDRQKINGTKSNRMKFTCKICGRKLNNSRPSITRCFYTSISRYSSTINNITNLNLTRKKLKKFRFLLKHELLHASSYKETRRLKFLLKQIRQKQ